jgi:hypothetical protein
MWPFKPAFRFFAAMGAKYYQMPGPMRRGLDNYSGL